MKKTITVLSFLVLAIGLCRSQSLSTEILSPADGSTIKLKGNHPIEVQVDVCADLLPAQSWIYADGVLISGGLFYVPYTVETVPWYPTRGIHSLESEVVEIDELGNYIRAYSTVVTECNYPTRQS